MNEDDLIKDGCAAALPNGAETGLVSYVTVHKRYRSFIANLLVSGKRDAMPGAIFGRVPGVWEEEDDEESDLAAAAFCERIDGAGAAR